MTSSKTVGLYILAAVSAADLKLIGRTEALRRIQRVLDTLEEVETAEGHFYHAYETDSLRPADAYIPSAYVPVDNFGNFPTKKMDTKSYVSTLGLGWLAAGLIVAGEAYPEEIRARAEKLLENMPLSSYFDHSGFHRVNDSAHPTYGWPFMQNYLLAIESRIVPFIAIIRGDLLDEWWFRLRLNMAPYREWRSQIDLIHRSTGFPDIAAPRYEYAGKEIVPSWGGSLSEFLMPTLILKEQDLAPEGLGLNNRRALDAHIQYALEEKKYPVWGLAPCVPPEDPRGWAEYGMPALGVHPFPDDGVVAPFVSFLALAIDPEAAIANLQRLAAYPGVYGQYGFRDSVRLSDGKVSHAYLADHLAAGLVALANHLREDALRRRFHAYPRTAAHTGLLSMDPFFAGGSPWPEEPDSVRGIRRLVTDYSRALDERDVEKTLDILRTEPRYDNSMSFDPRGRVIERDRRKEVLEAYFRGGPRPHDYAISRLVFLKREGAALAEIRSRSGSSLLGVFSRCQPEDCPGKWRWKAVWPLVPPTAEGAETPSGPLDGTAWRVGADGSARAELIVFKNGKIFSGFAIQRGFFPGDYSVSRDGDKIVWTAELPGTISAIMKCFGEISGNKMRGFYFKYDTEDRPDADPPWHWSARRLD